MARWLALPWPNDATVMLFGLARAAATSSAMLVAANDGCATTIIGEATMFVIGSILLSADATKAYVSTGRGRRVFIIDTGTNMVEASIEVGERPWGIALSPDGNFLYTANGPSNDVSVVDLSTDREIARVKAGSSPWGLTIVRTPATASR